MNSLRGWIPRFALSGFLLVSVNVFAADSPPSTTSQVGDTVTNPATGTTTIVTKLGVDPVGTLTAGTTAFVETADGYVFLVKDVGATIYNNQSPPQAFTIVSKDTTAQTVQLYPQGQPPGTTTDLAYQGTIANLESDFGVAPVPPIVTPPVVVAGAAGEHIVNTGSRGSDGSDGALVVPPTEGGDGDSGPTTSHTNTTTISTTNQIGIEIGSVGGDGGTGGDSYLSFWDGADGGDGGAGGTVNLINSTGMQVATTGDDKYGIFAYSRSGAAGDGGSGFAAPGGGTGGHSSNGGSVTAENEGVIITKGAGAFGIYGLSVSNNGGSGGSQWGLVGDSGSGGYGGSGGPVSITNGTPGAVYTSGDYAHGILAQSIGGSGGSAGTSGNLIVSLQGAADNGGHGGAITVVNDGAIATTGNDARGIFAQSVGGGGGTGGSSGGLVALGGSGSNGGNGSTVTVSNGISGTVTTTGLRSDGIFAQSVGGSGGSSSDAGGLVALGGRGDKGGNGGSVSVTNYGTITTGADGARGIVAQSIGGGGGDGGSSGGMVSVGGSGAGGGTSSTVSVTNGGDITTLGDDARGILAQSVGGGGGNGGSSGSIGVFAGVALGGTAGGGGAGGAVNLTLQGESSNSSSLIRTTGDRSTGVFAQSVGGGGGTGGGAVQVSNGAGVGASVAIGGSGGAGGAGGTVTLTNGNAGNSNIQTGGDDAGGVVLQSVGGGGGNGGYAVSSAGSVGSIFSGSISVGIGGSGANGGAGGAVTAGTFNGDGTVANASFIGDILTTGARSTGFLAQSVGGGGGNGGLAVSAAGGGSLLFSGAIGVGIGGSGAGGGVGGTVIATTQGNITTIGANSTGLLVQSVGGGGGNGGGSITATLAGSEFGAGNVSVAVGGSAGKGSDGGQVKAGTVSGNIVTRGESSSGIIVQSVGGGGGNGGYSVAAGGAGAGVAAGSVNVGLGGSGGGGGNGNTVTADLHSNVSTANANSIGILVQSVGGGGGNGGFNVSAGGAGGVVGAGTVAVGLGGSGATGGVGGVVTATEEGSIATMGDNSSGFVVQSIGGGGGNGGFNVSVSGAGAGIGGSAVSVGLGGKGANGNYGGVVTATKFGGAVTTEGDNSIGILAQSVGGGGGSGGFNISTSRSAAAVGGSAGISLGMGGLGGGGGYGGHVTLTVTNDVATKGTNSSAVVAQSVGGGGGNGGFNVSATSASAGSNADAITVGLGGSGGSGNYAGAVSATVIGKILTENAHSAGVLAQSVGGGGGNGGFNVAAGASGAGGGSGTIGVGLGGSGGVGGSGGDVFANVIGSIETRQSYSDGFLVQSIGGGGGNGGFNVVAGLSTAILGSGTVSVGLGGSGGSGNTAGTVNATLAGWISTEGDQSGGLIAQSIGGGGGNGGFNVSAGSAGPAATSGYIGIGLGGTGGTGGGAGAVTVHKSGGNVVTKGNDSTGILAQSVGGGGGNGGFNVNAGASIALTGSGTIAVGLGGSGGAAGNGNTVDLTVENDVGTSGKGSSAVVAQSIGGGGGNGGFNVVASSSRAGGLSGAINVGLGGSGGGGGSAGNVTAKVTGNLATDQHESRGFVAQSIGGGGGNGGFNVAAGGSGAGTVSGAIGVSLGGNGGSGGTAGTVDATQTGWISTHGDNSGAFIAQSIGGGGGNGGFSVVAGGSTAGNGSGAISVGLGGSGGSGNHAGSVTASKSGGAVMTQGDNSIGILAQSLGGGGGNGGFNISAAGSYGGMASASIAVGLGGAGGAAGDAADVSLTVDSDVRTAGRSSAAITAQSIGGGGGNGGFNVSASASGATSYNGAISVGLGGSGGAGGSAGDVTSYIRGNIETEQENSAGLIAQSIGGGGGNGGFSVAASDSVAGNYSGAISVGLGGTGGAGGSAGDVTANMTGNIETKQRNSTGLLAQSIGGGGGNGGFNVSAGGSGAGTVSGTINVGLGGSGGSGNQAGKVNASSTGSITTAGDNSAGFVAQSLGGGGGNGGFNVSAGGSAGGRITGAISVGLGGSGGDGNDAGTVDAVTSLGPVMTSGNNSIGVLAQSVGGGGGNGGFNVSAAGSGFGASVSGSISLGLGGSGGAGGKADTVTLTVDNDVHTVGKDSSAVVAQSIGGGGGNGGFNVLASGALGGSYSGSLSAILGGVGSSINDAGDVTANVTGAITTALNNSSGVIAQSIGGGGGNSGFTVAGAFVLSEDSGQSGFAYSNVGGLAGAFGAGKNVSVTRSGATKTVGDNAYGILAQSLGGGGGNGGLNVSGSLGGPDSKLVSASVGGFGGATSGAGNVTVNNTGNIFTGSRSTHAQQIAAVGYVTQEATVVTGRNANGILAQSIGGGGGNGGFSFSGRVGQTGENSKVDVGLTVGGSGGSGGRARGVAVTNDGVIVTQGAGANGIAAQSIGGGGGNGSSAVTGLLAGSDPKLGGAVNLAVIIGGSGGDENISGDVIVDQSGGIETHGADANGILAQSIGGGGGSGGGANALSMQLATSCTGSSIAGKFTVSECKEPSKASVNAQVIVGGRGGMGNDAGTVTVINNDFITTMGNSSLGIQAQSIGGGGGNGGKALIGVDGLFPEAGYVDFANAAATLPLGTAGTAQGVGAVMVGGGASNGNGNTVNVANHGAIRTSGADSIGIFAQSVGGGGGTGGGTSSGLTGLVNIGGLGNNAGEGGGNGSTVSVTNTGSIATGGADAFGVFAQSIGGGGGAGGAKELSAVYIGGFGNVAGDGGVVDILNTGVIATKGDGADALRAQSVGGGGGSASGAADTGSLGAGLLVSVGGLGGASGGGAGNGGQVSVNNANTLFTAGEKANGIFAQSIGGGGGAGGRALGVITVGGDGGNRGDGGAVNVSNQLGGGIWTKGDLSNGIFAQSIGGGGGDAGGTYSDSPIAFTTSVGGRGTGGGQGLSVTVDNVGQIRTDGRASQAIFAQSVGGGGGNGGVTGSFNIVSAPGNLAPNVSVGGNGSGGGNGGAVTVTNRATGSIYTNGADSTAIFAQSVGGGGGNGGSSIASSTSLAGSGSVALGGNGAGGGEGAAVSVTNEGDIYVNGKNSLAIMAQSVGGGGGTAGSAIGVADVSVLVGGQGGAVGAGGDVTVSNSGSIHLLGKNSLAMFYQSVGGGGGLVKPGGGASSVSLGSLGGSGSNGGKVIVNDTGEIVVAGDDGAASIAQSIGGGGGSSHSTFNVVQNGQSGFAGEVELGEASSANLGGTDVSDSDGGVIDYTHTGNVQTLGNRSQGMIVQSVGGGGGNAFLRASGTPQSAQLFATLQSEIPSTLAFAGALGGSAVSGSDGGAVSMSRSGGLVTMGDYSPALVVQSIGGGGGQLNVFGMDELAVSLGGTASTTGDGGEISLINKGSVITSGKFSHGLVLQSIGGGGGLVVSDTKASNVDVVLRADNSGDGGDITLKQRGIIDVGGDRAYGVLAQSIGGGGGFIDNVLRGSAGGTGRAGDIQIHLAGSAIVRGRHSIALFAQSEGRDGAGDLLFDISGSIEAAGVESTGLLGISSSDAGSGKMDIFVGRNLIASGARSVGINTLIQGLSSNSLLSLEIDGSVLASGVDSIGLLGGATADAATQNMALNIGGSAIASGKRATAIDLALTETQLATGIELGIGDNLGATGEDSTGISLLSKSIDVNAGSIDVKIGADVVSSGTNAVALKAESAGVDSGNIAVDVGGSVLVGGDHAFGLNLHSDGGSSSGDVSAMVGKDVIVTSASAAGINAVTHAQGSSGDIRTDIGSALIVRGTAAVGVKLESRGGSNAGAVDVNVGSHAAALADDAIALDVSSESTNGSAGPIQVDIAGDAMVEGRAATGLRLMANGKRSVGDTRINLSGGLFTAGEDAHGVVASVTGADITGDTTLNLLGKSVTQGDRASGIHLTSAGGRSTGDINVNVQSDVISEGALATGIVVLNTSNGAVGDVALTVNGGLEAVGDQASGLDLTSRSLGGVAGDVSAIIKGTVVGSGIGVTLLQLVSEGDTASGNLFASLTEAVSIDGNNGRGAVLRTSSDGTAGAISVATNSMTSSGANAQALIAESLGEQRSGNIAIDLFGDINAAGSASTAITARSIGAAARGDITVDTAPGASIYTGAGGIGVFMDGGNNNLLSLRGQLSTADGLHGTGVKATSGNDRIENGGMFVGQFDLGAGQNQFANRAGAGMVLGPELHVGGVDSLLLNEGAMSLGGPSVAQETHLQGSFSQSATGISYTELDFATDTVDQLLATGTASLNGKLQLTFLNPELIPTGDFSRVLFQGETGVVDAGLELIRDPNVVMDYSLDYSHANEVRLSFNVDFGPDWLGGNLGEIGDYLNAVQNSGSMPKLAGAIVNLLSQTDQRAYRDTLLQFSPEFYAQQTAQQVRSNQAFGERLFSCEQVGGEYRFSREGTCAWVQGDVDTFKYQEDSDLQDAKFDIKRYSLGYQKTLENNVSLGIGGSTETADGDGWNDNWNGNTDIHQIGLALKYQLDAWKISSALTYARVDADTQRLMQFDENQVADSSRDADIFGALMKGSYDFTLKNSYIRPAMLWGYSQWQGENAQENNVGELGLRLEDQEEDFVWLQPSIEAGYELASAGGSKYRFRSQLGYQHYVQGDEAEVQASFIGSPEGISPMSVAVDVGQDSLIGVLGIDALFTNSLTAQFMFSYQEADHMDQTGGHIRFSMRF